MNIKKQVKQAFKEVGLFVDMRDEYINIARNDGAHCEFYGQQGKDYAFACATYTVNGMEQDLDFALPEELPEFVSAVQDILNF